MAKGHFVFVGEGDARIIAGSMGRAERLAPLSFHGGSTHVRVHATKRYHLSRTHRRIVLASRQKQPVNVHVHAETFIQLRSSGERAAEKKGTDDHDCGWLNGSTTDERVRNASSTEKGSTLSAIPRISRDLLVNEELQEAEKIGILRLEWS